MRWDGLSLVWSPPRHLCTLTSYPQIQQRQHRLGAPFAAFQAATAGLSSGEEASVGGDDQDEDYSGSESEEESEEEASLADESEDSDAAPRRKRKAPAKGKGGGGGKKGGKAGTPASSSSARTATTTATPMNARLFSPATPHTGGGRASFASSSASAGGVLDDDDEASVGSKGKGKGGGAPRADGVLDAGKHTHHGLKWLWPPERRDGEKRTLDDPMYNPRTLYVPPQFIQKETPAMRQWWEFKSKNFDTILFFKVRDWVWLVCIHSPACLPAWWWIRDIRIHKHTKQTSR